MGRKHSHEEDDHDRKSMDGRHSGEGKRKDRSPDEEPSAESKIESQLNLEDLGAGYEAEDKQVARAIKMYNEKLLPFISEHSSIFARSGVLRIKGYASGIKSELDSRDKPRSHRTSPVMHDEDRLDWHRNKKPRHST